MSDDAIDPELEEALKVADFIERGGREIGAETIRFLVERVKKAEATLEASQEELADTRDEVARLNGQTKCDKCGESREGVQVCNQCGELIRASIECDEKELETLRAENERLRSRLEKAERVVEAASNTLAQQRKEFERGEIPDLDELDDALAELEREEGK